MHIYNIRNTSLYFSEFNTINKTFKFDYFREHIFFLFLIKKKIRSRTVIFFFFFKDLKNIKTLTAEVLFYYNFHT